MIHGAALGRKMVIGIAYAGVLFGARWLAYQLRFDFEIPEGRDIAKSFPLSWAWEIPVKLAYLYAFGQFSGLMSYFSLPDLKRIFFALGLATGTLFVARSVGLMWSLEALFTVSRGILVSDFFFSIAGLTSLRLAFRIARENQIRPRQSVSRWRVGIVGAGDAGAALALELLGKPGLGLRPVAFFDDDRRKHASLIHGIPVMGDPDTIPAHAEGIGLERIIIAMPTAPAKRIRELTELLTRHHIRYETVPGLDQLATGAVKLLQLRPVEISDLLKREPVQIDHENIQAVLRGKVVAVTGAGGSIGQELCRQILSCHPAKLLVIERSEVQLFLIEQDLADTEFPARIIPLVADVSDRRQVDALLKKYRPQVIYHAAAHKHVPIMERQPAEALRNNALGTAELAESSRTYGVERFVLISTDKAVNPSSVMGLSKRLAEIYIQALHSESPRTKFMAVRFGNVLGSSGSVIPVFQRQIARGGPVLVTHPEVSRYFMTIPEAVALVLQASAMGEGGEIFMLEMGRPIKILDLARQLITMQGLRPDEDIAIRFIGLRPGEKLEEELRSIKESTRPTSHPKIVQYTGIPHPLEAVREVFESLRHAAAIPRQVYDLVPEYQPAHPHAPVAALK